MKSERGCHAAHKLMMNGVNWCQIGWTRRGARTLGGCVDVPAATGDVLERYSETSGWLWGASADARPFESAIVKTAQIPPLLG